MTAPATPPPGGTEYRPGLPSVEDVRAHEERGKRWHRRHRDGTYPADIVSLYIHAREGTIWEHDGGGARPAVADTLFEYRPCLPDGTPCPWPGDAPAAQQAPALTPAEQELRTEAEHGIWEDNHLEDCRRRMPAPAPAQPAQLTEEERRAQIASAAEEAQRDPASLLPAGWPGAPARCAPGCTLTEDHAEATPCETAPAAALPIDPEALRARLRALPREELERRLESVILWVAAPDEPTNGGDVVEFLGTLLHDVMGPAPAEAMAS